MFQNENVLRLKKHRLNIDMVIVFSDLLGFTTCLFIWTSLPLVTRRLHLFTCRQVVMNLAEDSNCFRKISVLVESFVLLAMLVISKGICPVLLHPNLTNPYYSHHQG